MSRFARKISCTQYCNIIVRWYQTEERLGLVQAAHLARADLAEAGFPLCWAGEQGQMAQQHQSATARPMTPSLDSEALAATG